MNKLEYTEAEIEAIFNQSGTKLQSVPKKMQGKKIIGYYHVLMVNHYEAIVREQVGDMLASGLYDAAENIYIGCLGEYKDLKNLISIVKDHPKFIIQEYSHDKELYEFHTLNILKEQADSAPEEYYAFYIHTKGVSFSKEQNVIAYEGGNYWRRFMNEHILGKWKKCVAELDFGYETCGTQIRPQREWRMHYSGNCYWAKSTYIKALPKVNALNITDRFLAEFWIGMGNPIAATVSQEFVDYYSHRPKPIRTKTNKQGRNIVHTLCWNVYSEVERAVTSLYELNDPNTFEHILCDLSFPLIKGDEIPKNFEEAIHENSEKLKALAEKFGSKYVKMKNVGVSQNWTTVAQSEGITDDDVLICCDADEYVSPKAYGWVKAMADVIRGDDEIVVTSLIMEEQTPQFNKDNSVAREVNGIRIYDVRDGMMWATCAISGKFIKEMGGVPYVKEWSIYGHLESGCVQYMKRFGYRWAMLRDYMVKHTDNVPLLRQWKDDIIFGEYKEKNQIPFEKWLEIKRGLQK